MGQRISKQSNYPKIENYLQDLPSNYKEDNIEGCVSIISTPTSKQDECKESYLSTTTGNKQQGIKSHTLQRYYVYLNPKELKQYMNHIKYRKNYQDILIQIQYGKLISKQINYIKLQLYIQYLPLKLQQINLMHFLDWIIMYYWVCKGLQILFKQYGYFKLEPNMIGFTQQGNIRIWHNTKYSKSKPKTYYAQIHHLIGHNEQQQMIKDLHQLLKTKLDKLTLPQKFNLQTNTTFNQIFTQIQALNTNHMVPSNIYAIKHLLQSGRQINCSQQYDMKNQHFISSIGKVIKFNYGAAPNASNYKITFNNRIGNTFPAYSQLNRAYNGLNRQVAKSHSQITFTKSPSAGKFLLQFKEKSTSNKHSNKVEINQLQLKTSGQSESSKKMGTDSTATNLKKTKSISSIGSMQAIDSQKAQNELKRSYIDRLTQVNEKNESLHSN